MRIKQNLPNLLTLANLTSGCLGIVFCLNEGHQAAVVFVLIAAILDLLDGALARALKVTSPIGKDLDSLADMVTFGVLPGFMAYDMVLQAKDIFALPFDNLIFVCFIIPICSAIRLAKFNNDSRQSSSFIGLPTPANAIFFCGLSFALRDEAFIFLNHPFLIIAIAIITSGLLVAEIPMFSFKLKGGSWKSYKAQILFLLLSLLFLLLFQWIALGLIILLFILLSIINNLLSR